MWTRKRIAAALGSLLLGLGLTLLGTRLVWSDFSWLGVVLAPIWAATLFGGAYLFPKPMGEFGHPIDWVIGITLNAAFLGAILVAAVVAIQRALEPKNGIRAT